MSKEIEKIINDYPSMLREQALLANQIRNFRGLSQWYSINLMVKEFRPVEFHKRQQVLL